MIGKFFKSILPYIILLIILLPIVLPIILLIKLIDIVFQPLLYKKATSNWNLLYQENLKKGIWIDFPPEYGKVSIMDFWRPFNSLEAEDGEEEDFI